MQNENEIFQHFLKNCGSVQTQGYTIMPFFGRGIKFTIKASVLGGHTDLPNHETSNIHINILL